MESYPPISNNEALRKLLAVFLDQSGNLKPGAPGGALLAHKIRVYRQQAGGPYPALAYHLVPANPTRVGGALVNQDDNLTIWYGSDPAITEVTGVTLKAGQGTQLNTRGDIYIYTVAGAPIVEYAEVYFDAA